MSSIPIISAPLRQRYLASQSRRLLIAKLTVKGFFKHFCVGQQ
jgi:hypothetical protein